MNLLVSSSTWETDKKNNGHNEHVSEKSVGGTNAHNEQSGQTDKTTNRHVFLFACLFVS